MWRVGGSGEGRVVGRANEEEDGLETRRNPQALPAYASYRGMLLPLFSILLTTPSPGAKDLSQCWAQARRLQWKSLGVYELPDFKKITQESTVSALRGH